jgi:hypothetical protein
MNMQPIAQNLAARGRGGDSLLVHMTPSEVGGLQALAQAHGGSLTTNPDTGLPEANFLKSILPTIIGLGITAATGGAAAPWMVGLGVGGGTALLTGDLNKGLMAGLGAFGGAGLGSTLMGMGGAAGAGASGASLLESGTSGVAGNLLEQAAGIGSASGASPSALGLMGSGAQQAFANPGAFGSQLMSNLGGPVGAGAAALGTIGNFNAYDQPQAPTTPPAQPSNYEGPYMPQERQVSYPDPNELNTSEFNYFSPSNPVRFAAGGSMAEGFQTFGGTPATDNLYAFNPDSPMFRNELEKLRILGRQTSAGIPMNVSGINMQGEPIYETSTTYNIPELTEADMGVARDALGITGIAEGQARQGDQLAGLQKSVSGMPAPLTFKDMTDNDMAYLKSTLGINPSVASEVTPPTPSPSQPTFTPRPDAPPVAGSAPRVDTAAQEAQAAQAAEAERNRLAAEEAERNRLAAAEAERNRLAAAEAERNRLAAEKAAEAERNRLAAAEAEQRRRADIESFAPGFYDFFYGTTPAPGQDQGGYGAPGTVWGGGNMNARGGVVRKAMGGLAALAAGGELLEDGSFVVDARTVAELGNGSSNAGMELLMQLGGRPVQGPGDGVSDSIPATIEGEQAAAVARDEVIFDPAAVAQIGGGDPEAGAQRLYSLMRRAEEARKQADRGEDSGVAAGLGAMAPMMSQMTPMGV